MKKDSDSHETIVKEFIITDSNAVQHNAVIVGVLEVVKYQEPNQKTKWDVIKGKSVQTITRWNEDRIVKELSIGLSITNPTDKYDVVKGTMIAEGRALKPNKQMMQISTESRGALGREMVNAILVQQIDFIQKNVNLFMQVKKIEVTNDLPF